jgi:hypothetical protein
MEEKPKMEGEEETFCFAYLKCMSFEYIKNQ